MALQCDVCFDEFNLDSHRPKSLPCGHSICRECVQNPAFGRRCPTCRKDVATDVKGLPDNILAIRLLMEDEATGAPPRKVPRVADARVQQLERGVEAGRKLVKVLRKAVPVAVEALNHLLDSSVAQLRQMEEALERLQQSDVAGEGEEGTSSDRRSFQDAVKQLHLVGQLTDSTRLLATDNVSVVAEQEGVANWRASAQLRPSDHLLRLLLLQLHTDGLLQKVEAAEPTPALPVAHVGPPRLSILAIHHDRDYDEVAQNGMNVDAIVRNQRRWKNARILQSLYFANADELLSALHPHLQLEEIEIPYAAGPWVLEEVEKITSLRTLIVTCDQSLGDYPDLPLQLEALSITYPSEDQLLCLELMPRLRSLNVEEYSDEVIDFPPSEHGSMLWLGVSFTLDQEATMMSLIRAYASTVQELQISCAIEQRDEDPGSDYYFPNLGEELVACRFQALQRLVLQRPEHLWHKAPNDACLLQRQNVLRSLNSSVDVLCGSCHCSVL